MTERIKYIRQLITELNTEIALAALTHDVCIRMTANHDIPARPVEIELVRFIEKGER